MHLRNPSAPKPVLIRLHGKIEAHWREINKVVLRLGMEKIDPLLQLYSTINEQELAFYQELIAELGNLSFITERLTKNLLWIKSESPPELFSSIGADIQLQRLWLNVATQYANTVFCRKKKSFSDALESVQKLISATQQYRSMVDTQERKLEAQRIMANAYNHKAKIHRCLAGVDPQSHHWQQFAASLNAYEVALTWCNDKVLLNSVGFLLTDMSMQSAHSYDKRLEYVKRALQYHQMAFKYDARDPNTNHGIGSALYQCEKYHDEMKQGVSCAHLEEALAAFAITEVKQPNARLYHDRGLVYLLLNNNDLALADFNKGLQLDPHHILLRYKRGLLLFKKGEYRSALSDLLFGRTLSIDVPSLKMKYDAAIFQVQSAIKTRNLHRFMTPVNSNTFAPGIEEYDIRKIAKRANLEEALRACAEYTKEKKPVSVFISYAWGNTGHEQQVETIAKQLEMAGFEMLLDRWFVSPGNEIVPFVKKLFDSDYILVMGTQAYLAKYNREEKNMTQSEHVVRYEMSLIEYLCSYSTARKNRIIPLLLEGTIERALPKVLHPKIAIDFVKEDYCKNILLLVRVMYGISSRDIGFKNIVDTFERKEKQIEIETTKTLAVEYEDSIRKTISTPPILMRPKEPVNNVIAESQPKFKCAL